MIFLYLSYLEIKWPETTSISSRVTMKKESPSIKTYSMQSLSAESFLEVRCVAFRTPTEAKMVPGFNG
jgi:hypothetical protein